MPKQDALKKTKEDSWSRLVRFEGFDLIELPRDIGVENYTRSKSFREFQIIPNGMQFAETEFRRSKVCYIQRFREDKCFRYCYETSTTCQFDLFILLEYMFRLRTCIYSNIF